MDWQIEILFIKSHKLYIVKKIYTMVVFHELSKTCQIFSMSKTNQNQAMHTRIKLNFYKKIVNSVTLKMLPILP